MSLRARFLETPHSRNLRGCLWADGSRSPESPAGIRSPSDRVAPPRLRPPAPSGPRPTSLLKSPRVTLLLPGVEVNFPRPGDEEREPVEQPRQPLDHPHGSTRGIPTGEANSGAASAAPPASQRSAASSSLSPVALHAGRRSVSAASGAAASAPGRPVALHCQSSLPEPLLHLTAAPQPPARSPQPRFASAPAPPSEAPIPVQPSARKQADPAGTVPREPPRARLARGKPAPRGRAGPIRKGGGAAPAHPPASCLPPAPSRTRRWSLRAPAVGVQRGESPEAQLDTIQVPVKPRTQVARPRSR